MKDFFEHLAAAVGCLVMFSLEIALTVFIILVVIWAIT